MNKAQLLFETNSWCHWIVAARNLSHLFRDLENENHPGSMGKREALGFFQWPKFGGWARVPGKRWVEWGCTSVKSTFPFFRHPPFQKIKVTYIIIYIYTHTHIVLFFPKSWNPSFPLFWGNDQVSISEDAVCLEIMQLKQLTKSWRRVIDARCRKTGNMVPRFHLSFSHVFFCMLYMARLSQ